ncbi:EX3L2 protein, partial [Gymnorhina tibicen]|nr:EX3L2 protein [Gymnorhina tibicen]
PREVLGHPEVGALLQAQELGPLLPPETQRDLESSCIAAVKAKVEVAVAQELQLSEDTWPEDVTSQDMEEGLATRVTGLLRAHVDRAPQVTPEFGREMAHSLLGVLVAFLHRWDTRGRGGDTGTWETWGHRDVTRDGDRGAFADRLAQFGHPDSEEPRRQAHAALDRVTRVCGHVLTRRLFEDLKPYFGKLMKRKWLTSSDAFDAIVMLITGFAQTLRPLHPEPHQTPATPGPGPHWVPGRVTPAGAAVVVPSLGVGSGDTRGTLVGVGWRPWDAAPIVGCWLSPTPPPQGSASPWLDSVVPRLRELLVLEDTAALQMEVGALARDFPDVRRRHVAALLDARGLRAQGPRREILGVLQDRGG